MRSSRRFPGTVGAATTWLLSSGLWSTGGATLAIQPDYGRSIICALARVGGEAVGVVANQPAVLAGSIDTAAAEKAAHFIAVCDTFHLPLLFLSDNPGVLAGTASERAGVLRASARMYAAQTRATTTKIHVTVRKAFGFGSCVMAMNPHDNQTLSYVYPAATVGAMGAARRGTGCRCRPAGPRGSAPGRGGVCLSLGVSAELR